MAGAYTIGTRGSALALAQTAKVMELLLERFRGLQLERKIVRTTGDQRQDVPLAAVGVDGIFVKELEQALIAGEIDLAVHSLKDLPTQSPPELAIAAYLPRADSRDALVTMDGRRLRDLPDRAVIGTGSLRRRSQLAMINPSWQFKDIRGNLETRLAKLLAGDYDALILAAAGLERLGQASRITERLPYSAMLPAPGQGAIAIQIRAHDAAVQQLVEALDDSGTRAAALAERSVLAAIGGGCLVPLGAHAQVQGDHLILDAVLATPDGTQAVRGHLEGPIAKPRELGAALATDLLARGGRDILDIVRSTEAGVGM